MAHNEDYIVEILQDVGLITGSQLEDARASASDGNVLKALVDAGVLTQEDITRTLAAQNGMEFVDLSAVAPPPDVLEIVKVDDAGVIAPCRSPCTRIHWSWR